MKTLGVTLDTAFHGKKYLSCCKQHCCLILSKLDYYNSLLSGLPPKQIKRLQAVRTATARTAMKCEKKKIISLPFLYSFIGFSSRNGSITNFSLPLTGQFMISSPSTSLILKNTTFLAFLDQYLDLSLMFPGPGNSKTKRYGQQAFRYVAPSLWNVLPESIKEKDSIQSFRPSLKTPFLYLGIIVNVIVYVSLCWCVC